MLLCKFCSKECKNENSLRNHERLCKLNPDKDESTMKKNAKWVDKKIVCIFCKKDIHVSSIKRHEESCKSNPKNLKECPVCNKIFSSESITCSYACSNTFFRSGYNHPNWKESAYRTTCFHYHEKKCIICGETNIVEVHHIDESKENNKPENLIPLCPTHHQYFHSRFKHEVKDKILNYQKIFILGVGQRLTTSFGN